MYLLLDRQMCDSQRGVYLDVGSDEHNGVGNPQILRLKFNRCKWPIRERKKERVREREKRRKKRRKRASFDRSFLPLIATIYRNLPLVNNRITEIASFFDPAQIPRKSRNLRSAISPVRLSSCRICNRSVIA